MTYANWLGLPLKTVRCELEAKHIPYAVKSTCAPSRQPFGDDERVIQVLCDKEGICITICTFKTKVTG